MVYFKSHVKALSLIVKGDDDMASSRKDNRGRALRKGESQRKDGLYQYRYTDPMKVRRTIYDADLNELRRKEAEIEKQLGLGINYHSGSIKLMDQIELMLEIKTNLSSNTLRSYKYLLVALERHPISCMPINKISTLDCKRLCCDLVKDGYAFGTIAKIKSIIKEALKLACEDNILPRNPCDFTLSKVIEDTTEKVSALTKAQKTELLEFLRKDRYYARYYDDVVVLLDTGLRIGEYCGVTLPEIDFQNHVLHVRKQLVEGTEGLYVSDLKTENAERDIPLMPETEISLRRIINKRSVTVEPMVDGYVGFLCLSKNGRPRYNREFNGIFKRILKRFNRTAKNPIERLTPHVLRHTFCTELIAANANIKSVQYLMGHAFASTTLDVYTDFDFDNIVCDISKLPVRDPSLLEDKSAM